MKEKTWPYGTQYKAEVMTANKMLISVNAIEIDEAFIPIGHGVKPPPKEVEIGKIVFMKGGPTGGYWKWFPSMAQSPSPTQTDK
jgi:hypothetical protein